jgi:GGDEF domain-containing protein
VARYGADEFALLLEAGPRATERVLLRVADKLRDLSDQRGLSTTVQCRIGVAYREVPPNAAKELFRDADKDLRRGRRIPA